MPAYVRARFAVRVEVHPGCSSTDPDQRPDLIVNGPRNRITGFDLDEDAFVTRYDLILESGKDYRIALECWEDRFDHDTYIPWIQAAGPDSSYYRISTPSESDSVFFWIPRYEGGDQLELLPSSSDALWGAFPPAPPDTIMASP